MDKKGYTAARDKTNEDCRVKAVEYWLRLPMVPVYRVVKYQTDRGPGYGVVVNEGQNVSVWNAFREKIETFSAPAFAGLLIDEDCE